jgi:hypothetical protein
MSFDVDHSDALVITHDGEEVAIPLEENGGDTCIKVHGMCELGCMEVEKLVIPDDKLK